MKNIIPLKYHFAIIIIIIQAPTISKPGIKLTPKLLYKQFIFHHKRSLLLTLMINFLLVLRFLLY